MMDLDVEEDQVVKVDPLSLSWDFRNIRVRPISNVCYLGASMK